MKGKKPKPPAFKYQPGTTVWVAKAGYIGTVAGKPVWCMGDWEYTVRNDRGQLDEGWLEYELSTDLPQPEPKPHIEDLFTVVHEHNARVRNAVNRAHGPEQMASIQTDLDAQFRVELQRLGIDPDTFNWEPRA